MKHTLTLALAILLLAATGRGQSQTNQIVLRLEKLESAVGWTNAPYGVVLHVPTTEETVRKLAASGEICRVFGHWYPNVWIGERKCKLCGKVEPDRRTRK